MKRVSVYALGVILLLVAGGAIFWAKDNGQAHDDKNTASSVQAKAPKQACSIFTLANAKQLLGDNAKGGDVGVSASTGNLQISTCKYSQDSGSNVPVSSTKSATLLMQAPKTSGGVTSNLNQFNTLKPADAQPVAGYGDSAYWDPQYGQLDILKNNTWYILSNGPITPSARTLDQATQMADLLIDKM